MVDIFGGVDGDDDEWQTGGSSVFPSDADEWDSGGAEIIDPPLGRLFFAAGLAFVSVVVALLGGFRSSIIGYGAAVVAIILVFSFKTASERLRANERRFRPQPWTGRVETSIVTVSFVTTVVHALRIAWEIARRMAVVVFVAGLAVQGFSSSPAVAQDSSGSVDAAGVYSRFLTCVADGRVGLVQVLVDESGSLRDTDPLAKRVESLQVSLQSLDVARRNRGTDLEIEVMLSGFGVDWTQRQPWTLLDDRSLPGLLQAAETFKDLNSGLDTDYYNAFEGARSAFAQRADGIVSATGEQPCQILFWVTDGVYDIEDRTRAWQQDVGGTRKAYAPDIDLTERGAGDLAMLAGEDLLCRSGGIADQLRNDETFQIAITLTNDNVASSEYELVERMVTGRSSGGNCGQEEVVGAVIGAADPNDFDFSPGGAPLTFPYEFSISDLVTAFTLDVRAQDDPIGSRPVYLLHPSGERLTLEASGDDLEGQSGELRDSRVVWTWYSDSRLYVEVDVAQGSSAGLWQLILEGNERPAIDLVTYAGYSIEFLGAETIRPGEPGNVAVRIVGENGNALGGAVLDELDFTLALVDPATGSELPFQWSRRPGAELVGAVVLDESSEVTELELKVVARPADPDSTLNPVERQFKFPIASPPGFPSIGEVKAPNLEGTGAVPIEIELIGDPESGGCVEFVSARLTRVPGDSITGLGAQPEVGACLDVPAGETRSIEIIVDVSDQGRGDVSGVVEIRLRSEASSKVLDRSVDFDFRLIPQIDKTFGTLLALALAMLGVLIPLAVVLFSKVRAAQYVHSAQLQVVQFEVEVSADGVRDRGESDFEDLGEGNYMLGDGEGPPVVDGWEFGRDLGFNPFRAAKATVRSPGAMVVVGSHGRSLPTETSDGVAFVSFGLRGSWALAIDEVEYAGADDRTPDPGEQPVRGTGRMMTFISVREEMETVREELEISAVAAFESHDWTVQSDESEAPEVNTSRPEAEGRPFELEEELLGGPPTPDEDDGW